MAGDGLRKTSRKSTDNCYTFLLITVHQNSAVMRHFLCISRKLDSIVSVNTYGRVYLA